MALRVATFATSHTLMAAALKVQAKEAEKTLQQASGQISGDFGGLGATSGKVLTLETAVSRSKAYADAATTADERVQQMYTAVGSMVDIVSSIKASIISFAETSSTTDALQATAQESLEQFTALLNTQYQGRYLFSGSAVDTKPVDLDALTTTPTTPSTADTTYYQGDDSIASVKVSADRTVSYGVTADNTAFEKVIRALQLVANSGDDSDARDEASDLLDTALDELTAVQSGLSLNASTLEDVVSQHEAFQDYTSGVESDLSEVDIAQVAADLSAYQSQLEAAYSAIGTVQSLSLTSFLK
jgi:flagellar hook-associated protein 3 FlgL